MTIDDGGPAYPTRDPKSISVQHAVSGMPHYGPGYDTPGMTLRDYFAAKAMQAMVAGPGAEMVAGRDERYDETNWRGVVAANAYEFADAMIEARKK